MPKPTQQSLELVVLLAALLFLVSGTIYFIAGLRGPTHPEAISGAGATCIYYGRDGLQCWPEFEDEGEAIVQDLPMEQAEPTGGRLRI